jgi:hypothetical protein
VDARRSFRLLSAASLALTHSEGPSRSPRESP